MPSDGAARGPYKPASTEVISVEQWSEDLMFSFMKLGAIRVGFSVDRLKSEVEEYTQAVVRAARDGRFPEIK